MINQLVNAENEKDVVAPASDTHTPDLLLENRPGETLGPKEERIRKDLFNEETSDILILPNVEYRVASSNEVDLFAEATQAAREELTPMVEGGAIITLQDEPELFAPFMGPPPTGLTRVKPDTETVPPPELPICDETEDSDEDEAEDDWDLKTAFDELAQEVRRVGREVFKSNRAALRNQESFENALGQMEQMSGSLGRLSAHLNQAATPHQEAVFQAKAGLCRDLFKVLDVLAASLQTADEVLLRLEVNTQEVLLRLEGNSQALLSRAANAPLEIGTTMSAPKAGRWSALWAWLGKAASSPPAMQGVTEAADASDSLAQRAVHASWEDSAIAALKDSSAAMRQWLEGQELLYERLMAVLETTGARTIQTVGHPFDAAWHRAVAVEPSDTMPDNYIVGEELTGYTLDGKVLRYAEVVVARQ